MDFQFIRDTYYSSEIPSWMHESRFENLMLYDRALDGTFYDKIPLSFDQEKTGSEYNELNTRRPAVKLPFPAMIAGLCARKLFGGRHVPRLKHKDPQFLLKVQALVEELRLPLKMLEAVKRGSVGSVCIMFKFLETPTRDPKENEDPESVPMTVKGVVDVKKAQYCSPRFNKFNELTGVLEHYLVSGHEMLMRNMTRDRENDEIVPELKYWFVKLSDNIQECIYYPLKEHDWNPVNSGLYGANPKSALVPYPLEEVNPTIHKLGFVQAVWIENLTGGNCPDGLSTFGPAMDNFIQIDYAKSQNGRGLKYGSAPQLVIKGDLRSESEGGTSGITARDPAYLIRLAADEKGMDGQSASTGHDAFLLETNGAAAKASDDFVSGLKHTTFEAICTARKDLESIKGTMSGKVIELIDEDFLDLIQELRLQYGDYGYLLLLKKICKAASKVGHQSMEDVSDKLIDGLTLHWPPLYLPDAQEIQFLADAMVQLTNDSKPGGKGPDGSVTTIKVEPLIDPELAKQFIAKQLDLVEESDDKPVLSGTQVSQDGLPAPQPLEVSNHQTPETDDAPAITSPILDALAGGPANS